MAVLNMTESCSVANHAFGSALPRLALVVDDSMLIRHTVCRYFEERGFQVESASNGLEALDALQTLQPDLIVTDLSMPKMTGAELISALKERPGTAETPIVVLAAKNTGSRPADEPRADAVVFKDIDIWEQLDSAVSLIFNTAKLSER
jgi:CheY-like chemotaxis protein